MSEFKDVVSIIVPTVGSSRFMAQTLASVAEQSYPHIEVIISENATVSSLENINRLLFPSNQRIRFRREPRRLSFSHHFNACALAASGDYLLFLSDDDILNSDFVEMSVSLLQRFPECSSILSRQVVIDEQDNEAIDSPVRTDYGTEYVLEGTSFFEAALDCRLPSQVYTYLSAMYKRRDFLRLGGFPFYPDGAHSDNMLFLRMSTLGSIGVTSSLFRYRVHSNSTGMSMPFFHLLDSSRMYLDDASKTLHSNQKLGDDRAKSIINKIKIQTNALISERLRHIYVTDGAEKLSEYEELRGMYNL